MILWMVGANASGAVAQGVGAQLFVLQTPVPREMKGSMLTFAKKNKVRQMMESKDAAVADRAWRGSLVMAFGAPPQDSEVNILFYDVQDGSRRYVEGMNSFLQASRKEKIFVQPLDLKRSRFNPNRRMEIVVTLRKQEVGSVKVDLIGERVKRDGKVDFSEEETRQR